MKVLVVEDDALLRRSIQRWLKAKGYEVILATNVTEGRLLLLATPIDVLLLDRDVHGENGWALKEEAPAHVKVVLMTGDRDVPEGTRYFAKGEAPLSVLFQLIAE